jgi:hypothetical protein
MTTYWPFVLLFLAELTGIAILGYMGFHRANQVGRSKSIGGTRV